MGGAPAPSAPLALPPALAEALRAAYAEGRRAYHTLEHAEEVARALLEASARLGRPASPEVYLAALLHDAVYDARPGQDELASAALARALILEHLPGSGVDVARVEHLILLTARHGGLRPGDVDAEAELFLDADLAILGAAPEAFDRYDEGVAFEYAASVAPDVYREGRRRFLEGLAARPRLFLSDDFHRRLDAKARANLARALSRLAPGDPGAGAT